MFANRKIILLILLLITISVSAYVVIVIVPRKLAEQTYEGAKKIGQDIRNAFQFTPQVIVNNTIVLQQQVEILELATVSQKFQHQYTWRNTWMGSTKKILITGSFETKAGFDLQKKFTVNIYKDKAIVSLPSPQLLSIEPLGDMTFHDEQGVWNWVDANDRTKAINAFHEDARKYAAEAAFIQQARTNMEKKLTEIFKQHGKAVEINFNPNAFKGVFDK
jgi:hypothetical protein